MPSAHWNIGSRIIPRSDGPNFHIGPTLVLTLMKPPSIFAFPRKKQLKSLFLASPKPKEMSSSLGRPQIPSQRRTLSESAEEINLPYFVISQDDDIITCSPRKSPDPVVLHRHNWCNDHLPSSTFVWSPTIYMTNLTSDVTLHIVERDGALFTAHTPLRVPFSVASVQLNHGDDINRRGL